MRLEDFLINRPIAYTPRCNKWNENGLLILEQFVPDEIIDNYAKYGPYLHGKPQEATAYMHNTDLLRLCTFKELAERIEMLLGEPGGCHLNLTGWTSTVREWHQDAYLSGDFIQDRYVAVWCALDDIHPDSGPYEYVPGSHLWGLFDSAKFVNYCLEQAYFTGTEVSSGHWHKKSEQVLTPMVEDKIRRDGLEVKKFLAKKGDLLLWCSRLLHQGGKPKVPGMIRKAVITHYSGIYHRNDMPQAKQSPYGGWFFPIGR